MTNKNLGKVGRELGEIVDDSFYYDDWNCSMSPEKDFEFKVNRDDGTRIEGKVVLEDGWLKTTARFYDSKNPNPDASEGEEDFQYILPMADASVKDWNEEKIYAHATTQLRDVLAEVPKTRLATRAKAFGKRNWHKMAFGGLAAGIVVYSAVLGSIEWNKYQGKRDGAAMQPGTYRNGAATLKIAGTNEKNTCQLRYHENGQEFIARDVGCDGTVENHQIRKGRRFVAHTEDATDSQKQKAVDMIKSTYVKGTKVE
jgi:hypothetical protein